MPLPPTRAEAKNISRDGNLPPAPSPADRQQPGPQCVAPTADAHTSSRPARGRPGSRAAARPRVTGPQRGAPTPAAAPSSRPGVTGPQRGALTPAAAQSSRPGVIGPQRVAPTPAVTPSSRLVLAVPAAATPHIGASPARGQR